MSNTPLSPENLEVLSQIDSATVSNAVEYFKVRDPVTGYASRELCCQFPDQKAMVGYAVTAIADTTTAGDNRPMRLHELMDMVQGTPKPVILVVQYVGPDRLRSCLVGDMFATALQKMGAVGVVTDMGVRDLKGIQQRASGFQVFCPGSVVSHGYGVYLEFNLSVSICGLTIQPGDLLHGDKNGLLTVPLEITEALIGQARRVQEVESEYFDFVSGSAYTYEGLKSRMGRPD